MPARRCGLMKDSTLVFVITNDCRNTENQPRFRRNGDQLTEKLAIVAKAA